MINSAKVVAILRGITAEEAIEHVACLLDYGINTVEITTNSLGWDQSVQQISRQFGERVRVGAGTVLTPEQVETSALRGAGFILTPNLDFRVVTAAKRHGLDVCAGVFTSSEIFSACEMGVDVLKIFPAAALPVNYPQLIKGPLSQASHFCAVGGVDIENAADYLQYYDSVGIGSALYRCGQSVVTTAERCQQLLQDGK